MAAEHHGTGGSGDESTRIAQRRRQLGIAPRTGDGQRNWALALSGGGIRSATFCLGLLRGMAQRRLLARIDYLSTVSGGGYIGAMFGRLVMAVGIQRAQELLADGRSGVLEWLRRNGRYLTPTGVFARRFGMIA